MDLDFEKLRKELTDRIFEWKLIDVNIPNDSLLAVHDMVFRDVIDENNATGIYLYYVGCYYHYEFLNEIAIEYYMRAIDKGYNAAIYELANVYYDMARYELTQKYLLMAIDKGNMIDYNKLGKTYEKENNYELAEKYYFVAMEKNDKRMAIYNIADMYRYQRKYDLARKYYQMIAPENDVEKYMVNWYLDQCFDVQTVIAAK